MSKPKLGRDNVVRELKMHLRQFVVQVIVSNFEATEEVGLNSTDFASLCLLLLHGSAPAGRLAELTGLTTGAVTGLVDRLERAGLVRREIDPTDRRKVIVVPDARRVERDVFPHFPSLQQAATTAFYEEFTIAELEVITDFMSRLASLQT
jgi:DNA-binding MarR family transcriptional regulator